MDYPMQTANATGAAQASSLMTSAGLMQAKPPRTLVDNIDELEKRLSDVALRAQGVANKIGGHSLQAVNAPASGSNSPLPQLSLQQKAAGLIRLLGDCEDSLNRIESAIG